MELKGIPITRKNQLERARKHFQAWSNDRVESKIYKATLFALCKGICPNCGVDMILSYNFEENKRPNAATLDHVVPLSEILEHQKYGLQIMCWDCNSRKGKSK